MLNKMDIKQRRELDRIPFAKSFQVENNEELCNATGFEVLFEGDEDDAQNWWLEFVDSNGEYHYGR